MKEIDVLCQEIIEAYQHAKNWRSVASIFGVSPGMAYRIANGYEPKDTKIRNVLGLPIYTSVQVCPVCGIVHIKSCPQSMKAKEYRSLYDIPMKELARRFSYREEIRSGIFICG